jgi:hypothetical protein
MLELVFGFASSSGQNPRLRDALVARPNGCQAEGNAQKTRDYRREQQLPPSPMVGYGT